MTIKKYHLQSMPAAQCHVELLFDDSGLFKAVSLVSYNTKILTLEYTTDIWCNVNYPVDCSPTTARHANRFTTEFFGRNLYHELKKYPVGSCVRYNTFYECMAQVQWYNNNGKRW